MRTDTERRSDFEVRTRFERNVARVDAAWQVQTVSCDLCGSNESRTIARKPGRVRPQVFSIVRCTVCGFVFVNPRIADALIGDLYDDAYYRGDGFDASVAYDTFPPGEATRLALDQAVETVREAAGGSLAGVRTLDVGCGAGLLVHALREAGADAFGQDSSATANRLAAEIGIPLLSSSIETIAESGERYAVVTAIEVIEHVPYPTAFVRTMARLLSPGGILLLGTGNWNVVRHMPGTPYVMPEGHLSYFTPRSMDRLFRNAGLVRRSPALNGTWTLCRILSRYGAARGLPVRAAAAVSKAIAPAYGPFPIAIADA